MTEQPTTQLTAPDTGPAGASSRRHALIGGCAALVLALGALSAGACARAYAGDWMEVSCVNPSQSAAPSEGWTSFSTGSPSYGSNNSTGCAPGSPMFASLSSSAAAPVGAGEYLQYTPPAGSTLIGGSIDVSLYADGSGANASGTAVAYSPAFQYDASNVFFQCASGLTPCGPKNGNDFTGVLGLPANRGGNLYLGAACGGAPGYACNAGATNGAWSLVRVRWANLLLSNTATPGASAIAGGLLEPGARGVQDLTLTATDPGGPGVYLIKAQIDGSTFYSGTPDTNAGKCSTVGASGAALMFAHSQPCKQSESVDLAIDTASLHDQKHVLKLAVVDGAQNSSVVYDAPITTFNAPVVSGPTVVVPTGPVSVGVVLNGQSGAWSAPSGAGPINVSRQWQDCNEHGNGCQDIAGARSASYVPSAADVGHTLRLLVRAANNDGTTDALSAPTAVIAARTASGGVLGNLTTVGLGEPNGSRASESAQLRLATKTTIKRPFSRRALRLTGRLLDHSGQAIAGATLDVLAQTAGTSTTRLLSQPRTTTDGSFVANVAPGPSRTVDIAYRAFSADTGYTTHVRVKELVGAGIVLRVSPRRTNPEGTIVLSGRVAGPVPAQGAIVSLLVHYRGRWVPFRTPRTDANGHFERVYQFEGAVGRFPFRAEVPSGQLGFPFDRGYSNPVTVAAF